MGAMEGEESAQELINALGEDRIMVSVRLRPLNEKEIARNNVSDWECINHNTVILKNSFAAERSMLPNAYTFGKEIHLALQLLFLLVSTLFCLWGVLDEYIYIYIYICAT